jgi:E3 ubiquitin-protein ligase CHFR
MIVALSPNLDSVALRPLATDPADLPCTMIEDSATSSTSRELAQQLNAVTLKRPASPSIEESEAEGSRKRVKESRDGDANSRMGVDSNGAMVPVVARSDANKLAEHLAQELQCACCSELVYRPVVVSPCQHFFCGRYLTLL